MDKHSSEIALQRFQAMGISARVARDGGCVLASMPLGKAVFPGPAGPQRFDAVLFATVDAERIKCLRPRPLFQLPIISIRGCRDPASIEARIRSAWQGHAKEIARTRDWLREIGTEATPIDGGSALTFAIDGEDPQALVTMINRRQAILPSRGPLAGEALRGPEERVVELDPQITSGLSLDIALSGRLEKISRRAARAHEERRHEALSIAPTRLELNSIPSGHRILLVGPRLTADRACIASLRLRGYNVTTAVSQQEAIAYFDRASPQLLLSDVSLGRSDGIELILALRRLAGIEDLPVILVDDRSRPGRRKAARLVGAAGYVVYPVDVSKIAKHLSRIIASPRMRRFTRYSSRLPVQAAGTQQSHLASALGRGGMFLATRDRLQLNTVNRYRLSLPDVGQSLRVDAEVLYSSDSAGLGTGLRFRNFPDSNEELLIQYLRSLEKSRHSV